VLADQPQRGGAGAGTGLKAAAAQASICGTENLDDDCLRSSLGLSASVALRNTWLAQAMMLIVPLAPESAA